MTQKGMKIADSLRDMHLIVRDEGLSRLSRVAPEEDFRVLWSVNVPRGRDLSLDAENRIVLGTGNGYELRDPGSGELLQSDTGFDGTQTVCLLDYGLKLLSSIENDVEYGVGGPANKGPSIVLRLVEEAGYVVSILQVPGYSYVRLVRPVHPKQGIPSGNPDTRNYRDLLGRPSLEKKTDGVLVMPSNRRILEIDSMGKVLLDFPIVTELAEPHTWKVVKTFEGGYLVATGYQAELQLFDPKGRYQRSIRAPESTRPFFYSDFRRLPDGKLLVVNWQDHGPGHGDDGDQLLLFSPGEDWQFLDSWRPGPTDAFSSIQGVLPVAAD